IATVERRRRAPLARGAGRLDGAPRAGSKARSRASWTRYGTQTGCARGTRAPTGAPPSPWGGGNDATRPRSDAGEMRKERRNGNETEKVAKRNENRVEVNPRQEKCTAGTRNCAV